MNISVKFPWGRKRTFVMGDFELVAAVGFILLGLQMEKLLGARSFSLCIFWTFLLSLLLFNRRAMSWVFHPAFAFTTGYVFLGACLWERFTPDLSSYIWHDDAPMLFANTKLGLGMLRQGGVFGWNSTTLGGYPASFDGNYNLSLLSAPFMLLLGDIIGFNITMLLSMAVFPFLVYMCVRAWLPGNRLSAVWGVYFSFMVLNGYFGDFLGNCSFNRIFGIDFYILNLTLLGAYLKRSPLAGFFLACSLTVACGAAHRSYFVLSVLTTIVVVVMNGIDRKSVLRLMLLLAIVAVCVLPFVWHLIVYRIYFVEDVDHFLPLKAAPSIASVWMPLLRAVREALLNPPESCRALMPIFLWIFIRSRNRILSVLMATYICISAILYFGMQFTNQSFMRMLNGMAVFPVIFLSAFGGMEWAANKFFKRVAWAGLLFLLIATFMCQGFAFKSWTTPRLKDMSSYSQDFVREIRGLNGNMVLFDGHQGFNHATESKLGRRTESWSDDVHLVGVLSMATGKNFFTSGLNGWPPTVFRANSITCGTYRGKFLSEYPPQEIKDTLIKWGIRYLVLWSMEAKRYFGGQSDSYKLIWRIDTRELQRRGFEPVQWEIYEFLDADPRSVAVSPGSCELEAKDYFTKILRLKGVKRGEKAIVRMNYFPAWRAQWAGGGVDIFSENGQLALRCPADGDLTIRLCFPKYKVLTIVAVLLLAACFFLSKRGYV